MKKLMLMSTLWFYGCGGSEFSSDGLFASGAGAAGANNMGGSAGNGGAMMAGSGGNAGTSGHAGLGGQAGNSGNAGFSGFAGHGGSGGLDNTGGHAGSGIYTMGGNGGSSQTAGNGGTPGSSGSSGKAGDSGSAGIAGASGMTANAGMSGSSGAGGIINTAGGSGSGGTSGSSGSSGNGGSSTGATCNQNPTPQSWGFGPGTCYEQYLTNGSTCLPPPDSTPDGVCQNTTCWTAPSQNQDIFVWTSDGQLITMPGVHTATGIIYMVVPAQPTCTQSVALSQQSGWNKADISAGMNGQYTVTAPGSNGQPVLFWISVIDLPLPRSAPQTERFSPFSCLLSSLLQTFRTAFRSTKPETLFSHTH